MPTRELKKASFRNNYFIYIPIILWLCSTLMFTIKANIYADDANLLDRFEGGNLKTYLGDFLGWVPGRNLTIFFQYLLFKISFATSTDMVIYHLIAQVFYISIAALLGRFIFNLTRSQLVTSIFVAFYLLFPTNIQILNWGLSAPQHLLPTLFSILTLTFLTNDSKKESLKVSLGLAAMIFTYDQSAALAMFLIAFIISGLNKKLNVFNFNPGRTVKAFWLILIFAYFFSSFFGRKALGVASTLSKDSINLFISNLQHPFRIIARFLIDTLGGFTIVLIFVILLGSIGALRKIPKTTKPLLSFFNQRKNRLGLFLIFASFASFLPAALWYPDKRHFFLPATLFLMGLGLLIGKIEVKEFNLFKGFSSLVLVSILTIFVIFQNSELRSWESRDQNRKSLYVELSNQVNRFPKNSIFLIDDVDPKILNLFYAERMQSAYKYYTKTWKNDSPRIYQLSRIDNLKTCTIKENANSDFIRINLVQGSNPRYTFTPDRIDEDCLWNIFL